MAADHFCLRWNNYQSNMVSELDILRTEEHLVDVTLSCEGNKFRAHKVILSACSPYFRNVFKENPCEHPVVILKDVSPEDVEALLSFVYQGVVYVSEKKLCSFLQTAELLQIKGLAGAASSLSDEQAKAALAAAAAGGGGASPVKRRKSAPVRIVKQEEGSGGGGGGGPLLLNDEQSQQSMEADDDGSRSYDYSEDMMDDIKNEEEDGSQEESEGEVLGGSGLEGSLGGYPLPAGGGGDPEDRLTGGGGLMGGGGGGQLPPPVASLHRGGGQHTPSDQHLHQAIVSRLPPSAQHQSSQSPLLSGQYQVPVSGQPPLPELLTPPGGESRNGRRPCPLCTKVISNKSNLLKHMRIRHSDVYNPACCLLCNKIFKNKYSLRAHLNIYHKEYISPATTGSPGHQPQQLGAQQPTGPPPLPQLQASPLPSAVEQMPQPQYLPTGV